MNMGTAAFVPSWMDMQRPKHQYVFAIQFDPWVTAYDLCRHCTNALHAGLLCDSLCDAIIGLRLRTSHYLGIHTANNPLSVSKRHIRCSNPPVTGCGIPWGAPRLKASHIELKSTFKVVIRFLLRIEAKVILQLSAPFPAQADDEHFWCRASYRCWLPCRSRRPVRLRQPQTDSTSGRTAQGNTRDKRRSADARSCGHFCSVPLYRCWLRMHSSRSYTGTTPRGHRTRGSGCSPQLHWVVD